MRIQRNQYGCRRKKRISVKERAVYYGGIGILCLFLFGCHREEVFFFDEMPDTESLETISANDTDIPEESLPDKGEELPQEYVVHICGAVVKSGVFHLPEGSRIDDALQAAGGFAEDADPEYVNLAGLLRDGMKITIPTRDESEEWHRQGRNGLESEGESIGAQTSMGQDGKVNINTADAGVLCTLPGIGESKAASIIAYREANGPFQKPEDLMKVAGIKSAAYEKVKDFIIV
ncbi:MAG: helix-hairpin-helix domain-containing protein [Lachnospiraceae bacterium]|nr:helix-hairpin-helix domain-containing protein [Lachnospiraceae bacterium]